MENNRISRKRKKDTPNFIIQGSILAAAGIIVRLIGMVYRIPLAKIIGNEGNGYYTAAYSIYAILLIVSSYSLPVAVSKMIAVKIGRGEYLNSVRILKAALFYATVVGSIGAGVLWFGADIISGNLLKMPYTMPALKTLAPTIWIMAYLGVLRGYFQGIGTMMPTAVSQIFEQIVNAVISIVAATSLFKAGLAANLVHDGTEFSYAFGAAGGTVGTGAGAVAAVLFLLFILMSYRPVMRRQMRRDQTGRLEGYGKISLMLLITVLPVLISSTVYNISTVIDNGIYSNIMTVVLGRGEEVAATWGILGKYQLLFNIPVAIANALSSSLIPSLSRAVADRKKSQVISRITSAIRFSMIIAIPAAVGLTVLSGPINNLLFSGEDNSMLIHMTMAGSLAVVFFSLSTVSNAILQGINRMNVPIRNALISLVLHIIALLVFLLVFNLGIYSVVYANILFALFMCILNGLSIRRYLRYHQEIKKTFVLPAVCAAIMGGAAYGVYQIVFRFSSNNPIGTLAAVLVAIAVYGVLLLKLRCVDEAELHRMPGGTKILLIARKLHLM